MLTHSHTENSTVSSACKHHFGSVHAIFVSCVADDKVHTTSFPVLLFLFFESTLSETLGPFVLTSGPLFD